MDSIYNYLGLLIGKTLNGAKDIELDNKIDKEELLYAAMRCGVLPLVYPYVCNDDINYNSKAFKVEAKIVALDLRQKIAFDELVKETEKEKIDILMLKGIFVNSLYPESSNRTMRDIDLFYYVSQKKELFSVLKKLGYKMLDDNNHHSVWMDNNTGVYFEMHHTLELPYFYESKYLDDLLERKVLCEDKSHLYHMTYDDAYVFLMMHIYEDARLGSGSIKQLADLYVLKKHGVNFASLEKTLEEIKLLDFAKNIDVVTDYILESNDIELNAEQKDLVDFYFHVDGKTKIQRSLDIRLREEGSKFKVMYRLFFPEKKQMYIYYPTLRKYKYLLPFYYFKRLNYFRKHHKGTTRKELKKM